MGTFSQPPAKVRSLAAQVAHHYGLEIFELTLTRARGGPVLRVVLDRPWSPELASEAPPAGENGQGPGVTLQECEQVSHELGTLLDVEDVLPDSYTLEVSSPGLDRPLRGPEDYQRFRGRLAKIVMSEPVDHQTAFAGRLRGLEGNHVMFESEGGRVVRLPIEGISRARLEVEF